MALRSSAFENYLSAITLFTEDLDSGRNFYGCLLGLQQVFSDETCIIYKCGSTMINLIKATEAEGLVAPASVGLPNQVRAVYTLKFDDIDALARELVDSGIAILSGPLNQPWGVRTVSVQDPSGHVWEFANHEE